MGKEKPKQILNGPKPGPEPQVRDLEKGLSER